MTDLQTLLEEWNTIPQAVYHHVNGLISVNNGQRRYLFFISIWNWF